MWCFFNEFISHVEPKNFKEALEYPSWIEAMQEEIHEFERLDVWVLVPCLENILIIPLKWLFKIKLDEYGDVLKNKAWLVAKGYCQEIGIDFKESFAPVAKLEAIKIFITNAANPDHPSHVYRLKKALYGLKQAPRAWYDKLSKFLISSGFSKGVVDPTLFTRKTGKHYLLVQIYAKPTEMHLHAIKRIFCYLKGTLNMGLWHPKDSGFALTAFADADYAGCQDTRRSTSGFAQFLGGRLMRSQLSDYGFIFNAIPMYYDNQSAIALCCNSVQHSRSKHIDIRHHFIKEQECDLAECNMMLYCNTKKKKAQLSFQDFRRPTVRHNLVRGLPSKCFDNDHTFVACLKEKQHKASCKTKLVNSITKPLHTLHMDLFGPTSVSSINHKWYCLVVTDDFSRFTWTFFLKTKDETSGILRNFITEIENLKELKVKIIRYDNRGKFRNKEMNDFCSRKGIKREFSNARTPQQNGVAKRRNRTLIEAARTMLADAKLHVTFWAEVVNTACYVQNRVLVNKSQNKTSYELFNGRTPAIGFLKQFGCHVMILNTLDNLRKFEAKGDEGYFIMYYMTSKAFRVFNKRTKRVEENLHVDFLENKVIEKGAGPNWLFDIDSLTNSMNYVPVVVTSTNSTNFLGTKEAASQDVKKNVSSLRYIALPNWFHDAHLESSTSNTQDACNADAPESSGNSNPTATSTNPLGDHMETLIVETPFPTTSSPVPTACLNDSLEPSRVRPIGTKWVHKNKKDERGIVIRNKARLVAQGYTQEEGIDYDEVFAHVARIKAIRLFLAYASFMGFIVYQMDVNSAFLYGTIDEEVYVMQPPGFQDPKFPARVYKVEKAMYGLHQAFRAWYDVTSGNNPMDKENPWGKDGTGKDVDLHLYRSMIGSLMHLTTSRPDIMFAVCVCARHQVTPKEYHMHAVKRIFRYLKGHPKLGLWYPKESPFDLVAYSDSDYGGATQDRKSSY
nr:retrovirus-related Pol polyprotein from transposon TNT 1-94 [Tanacetum cinerariifolium]